MSKTRSARLHDALAAHVSRGAMPGLVALVSRRGETHVEAIGRQAFESDTPMRRDTIFRIASMTKPITAAATLILVEQCKLRLDDAVDDLLPELANRRVLKGLEGPVDDTVPAKRPISVRDLLTFTFGLGAVMVWPAKHPIQKAIADAGLAPGPFQPDFSADDFMKRLGSLPLVHQPGERWLYHTGADVLGVLIARFGPVFRRLPARPSVRAARHARHRLPGAGRQARPAGQRLHDGPAEEGAHLL